MKRNPLRPLASAQTKAAGALNTPPAAITNPIDSTNANAPDSTHNGSIEQERTSPYQDKPLTWRECLLYVAIGAAVMAVAHCTPAHAGSAPTPLNPIINTSPSNGIITTGTGFPCLVFSDITIRSGSNPHRQAGFYHAQILAGSGTPTACRYGYGRDGATRKDARTASDVSLTSRPPFAFSDVAGGLFNIPEGI